LLFHFFIVNVKHLYRNKNFCHFLSE
jgi:hypothetical protein